ncbi:MAG: class I SAM-dependent methyltransferase [Pseudonocardiaceae bacterium]
MREIAVEPWGAVESLLLAAGDRAEGLAETIRGIGLEQVTDVVVDELVVRCEVPAVDAPVVLQLELSDGRALAGRGLTIDGAAMSAVPGWVGDAVATVRFDVVDAVASLFDPSGRARQVSRDVTWLENSQKVMLTDGRPDVHAMLPHWQQLNRVVQAVVAACTARPSDLGELSVRFGSDKWASLHWYTQHYEQHFARFRTEPVRLLEIGIGGYQFADRGGESLRMWQRYFSRGLIYGLDIFDKPGVTGPRIRAVQGDQNDPEFLAELGRRCGPFDIIIDDGSHVNEHVKTSFRCLFPFVRLGGLYVVEDAQTAYWPGYGGDDRDLINADTSIGMLKSLVDGLNHKEIPLGVDSPSYTDRHVVGLHFYHNLAIVEKGVNSEDSAPSFIPREYSGGAVGMSP